MGKFSVVKEFTPAEPCVIRPLHRMSYPEPSMMGFCHSNDGPYATLIVMDIELYNKTLHFILDDEMVANTTALAIRIKDILNIEKEIIPKGWVEEPAYKIQCKVDKYILTGKFYVDDDVMHATLMAITKECPAARKYLLKVVL